MGGGYGGLWKGTSGVVAATATVVSTVINLSVKPIVQNQKLQNIINDIYKGLKNPNKVGNGTTMDAIRNEIRTGLPTQGKFHFNKGQQYLNALRNLIKKGILSTEDLKIAQALLEALINALAGK